jgi:hypothetical protein
MRFTVIATACIACAIGATTRAGAPVELELAAERGVQITAPHEWLQRLADLGIENVRIRGMRAGERPRVENRGTPQRPAYHVLGVLTARNQLLLPGGTFSRADAGRIKDYFARLAADGSESVTAPRGQFGLGEKELQAVFAELAQPIDFQTKGQTLRTVIARIEATVSSKIVLATQADRLVGSAAPLVDELNGLSAGTALAMALRSARLAMRPESVRGQPVAYRISPLSSEQLAQSTLGNTTDIEIQSWPIGWQPQGPPGQVAPSLSEFLNAEIDGYTLEETLAAIGPRVKIPIYLDHAALAAHGIDPAKIQVKLARTRTFYKRVLDRVLAQARLGSEVRIDEAGKPFLWITR